MTRRRRDALLLIGTFAAYAVLTVVMTWPLCARIAIHFIGNGDDMWVHYWNNWWVRRVLQKGGALFHTPLLFHPSGVSLLYHNFAWLNIAFWLVSEPFIGGVAAYNLSHIIHIPLCGLAMFLLVRRLTKSNGAAFVSGLVYAFWPYRMLDVNHPNMISTEGFPLLMLALIRFVRDDRSAQDGVLVALLVALIGYTRWQLLILAGVLVALYLAYVLICDRPEESRKKVAWLAVAGLAAMLVMAPGLYPLARNQLLDGSPDTLYDVSVADPEQDLLAWVIPQHQHALGHFFTRAAPGYGQSTARGRYSAFLGYATLSLAVLGVATRRKYKRTWFWVGAAVFCLAMALGPTLQINGIIYDTIPMPYELIGWLPPVQMLRHPHRFSALLALPVAALVGHGVDALLLWTKERDGPGTIIGVRTVTAVLTGLILADYWSVPTATVSAAVPSFYASLANDLDEFAVAGLPGDRQAAERYMFYQTEHGHPILSGHVSRLPPEALDFASSVPLITGIYRNGGLNTGASDISHQLSLLAEPGFRYIVIHKDLISPETLDDWKTYFAMAPRYEDAAVVAFSTSPRAGTDYTIEYELLPGIGIVDAVTTSDNTAPNPILNLEVVWGARVAPQRDFDVQLSLLAEGESVEQKGFFDVSPDGPLTDWSANTLARDSYSLEIAPTLGDGQYTIALGLTQDQGSETIGQRIEIGDCVIGESAEGRGVFPIDQRLRAHFGDRLLLLGYGLRTEDAQVRILLHWQALDRPREDYKFFVHLCAAETLDLIAQADVMPHGWAYPTTGWRVGEVISDEILLPIEHVQPGDYRLLVGAYSPTSGERLTIREVPAGCTLEQDRLALPDLFHR